MSSKSKIQKKCKAVFTIIVDRFYEDSSQQQYRKPPNLQNQVNPLEFQFPLDFQLEGIHEYPETSELSSYIKHLQDQVKSITNKIEFQYHQARETVLYIGQTTDMFKNMTRKKIDDQFGKMGIIRKYYPQEKQKSETYIDDLILSKDAGDLAIDQIKRKVQIEWQSSISDEMEKERRKLRELEKKKQKQLEQIDKDFQRLMKKRKYAQQQMAQFKNQESIKSLHNGQSSSNKAAKKMQKFNKVAKKESNKEKQSENGSKRNKSIHESEFESCSSAVNNQICQNSHQNEANSAQQQKINLLQASHENLWNQEHLRLDSQEQRDQFEDDIDL